MNDGSHEQINIFAQPLGTDFVQSVVDGLRARMAARPPEDMANVTLIVNTARMSRRIKRIFSQGPACFLPKVLLVTELYTLLDTPVPSIRPKLERHLQLANLLAPLLEQRDELGPRSSLFALCESLAQLLDEMQGEGVGLERIKELDVSDQSDHWAFATSLVSAAYSYVEALDTGMDAEARQRLVVQTLIAQWALKPPAHPVILVGSTGSRGTTALLMEALAHQPMGTVVLPGFDRDMPDQVWDTLTDSLKGEDHPQFRFARLLSKLGIAPKNVPQWFQAEPDCPGRTALVSLALRPAPVTDAWLTEGPNLPDLRDAVRDITLLEAPTQRDEALTIALRLRKAAEIGQTAALITPDRMLSRQVAAALDRWDIVPDDSAGTPLHLSAPGRFLRHCAELLLRPLDAELLLTVLKHPLTQSGEMFADHGLYTQLLEEQLRKDRVPFPDSNRLTKLVYQAAKGLNDSAGMEEWCRWICDVVPSKPDANERTLEDWLYLHKRLAMLIANGGPGGSGDLWKKKAGEAALAAIESLEDAAHHSNPMEAATYVQLLTSVLQGAEVRDRDEPHSGIMIWGTLEARVQGADLVILGSLNENTWPEAIAADPWLNRQLRHDAGLLLPDRRIGLAAHDFQQAICAPEVWLTRATRLDDAESVPSRWVNRLVNLMSGLPDNAGPEALSDMRARGEHWSNLVKSLEKVVPEPPSTRAAPCPPYEARPRKFSVTEIKTLIRDPYAIYAKKCLRLRPLDPLVQEPDAPIRGIVIHEIMERFVQAITEKDAPLETTTLMNVVDQVLEAEVPWPTERALWRARIWRIADWIVETETHRQSQGTPVAMEDEARGTLDLAEIGSTLSGVADRIDRTPNGQAIIYDYKSGMPPSTKEQQHFDKQLLLEAAMLEQGAFRKLGPTTVASAEYIGLGASPKQVAAPLDKEPVEEVLEGLKSLIRAYLDPNQPFVSRRMVREEAHFGDYDHLARHGEWDDTHPVAPENVR